MPSSGFSIEFCMAIAVVVTGVTLVYIYYTSTGQSTLTAVTPTCDTHDRCYGLRVTGSTENPGAEFKLAYNERILD